MPTVLLLDVSLSMFRPVPSSETTEPHTRFSLACAAIHTFLDYISVHSKLEYVSLVSFSSSQEVVVPFTRDFESIRSKLPHIEEGDKTCLDSVLLGVNQIVLSEWGCQVPVTVILITDGNTGCGAAGCARLLAALPLPAPCPLTVLALPLAAPGEPALQYALPLYEKMIELAHAGRHAASAPRGAVYAAEQLTVAGAQAAAARLSRARYAACTRALRVGRLEARVQLAPPARARALRVIGMLLASQMKTPITISKHLVIPLPQSQVNGCDKNKEGSSSDNTVEDDNSDPSKVPNFCVLLHGALKVEGMVALVSLGPNSWGVLSAGGAGGEGRARRSCLLLAVLGGGRAAPWLGPLAQLGPATDADSSPLPLRAVRSYGGGGGSGGGGGAGWSRAHALLADVLKVLRHARKLPEKTHHLYKELNRLRRAAIGVGFTSLLTCVSEALRRECAALQGTASQEVIMQLTHAATALADPRTQLDAAHQLAPAPPLY